jgi:hemerythrin superfamily protein
MKEASMTDATVLLTEDHRAVEQLFHMYGSLEAPTPEDKRELVEAMIRELSIHGGIEEQVFYPAVRAVLTDGDALSDELLHDHEEMAELLTELEEMAKAVGDDIETPQFDAKVRTLIQNVMEHVAEEEGEIFPKVREVVGWEQLERMGESLEKAKKLAPTHPHPKAPNTPPANLVAGPATGVVDRARDSGTARAIAVGMGAAAIGLIVWQLRRRGEAA